jgi:hypothetical protein
MKSWNFKLVKSASNILFECWETWIHTVVYTLHVSLFDWIMIDYLLFYVPFDNISLNKETSPLQGLQNFGLRSALRAFKQGGIFIVTHLLWHGASVFPVSSKGQPHLITFYDTQGDAEDLFWSRVPIQSPLTKRNDMYKIYITEAY